MDWHSVCIIDLKETKDITSKVVSIEKDYAKSRYRVVFEDDSKEYDYAFNRIYFYDKPVEVQTEGKLVFVKGKLQPEIKTILRFGKWCKIQFFDDVLSAVNELDILFVDDKRTDQSVSGIMDYLMEVSASDDSRTIQQDEEPSFLQVQLQSMPVREDSVLYAFFNSDHPRYQKIQTPIIAPFSSNKSQIDAIRNALENNLSVIQGPPGTGKTQTILNIIANLLIRGKNVAVVSGNNEATRNVYEKLTNEGLGSLCATLGNKENIVAFFESQPLKIELKELIKGSDTPLKDRDMERVESIVSKLYSANIERAELVAQIDELGFEENKFPSKTSELQFVIPSCLSGEMSSMQCLKQSAFIEALYAKKMWAFRKKLRMYGRFHFWPRRDFSPSETVNYLQYRYYEEKKREITDRISDIDKLYPDERKKLILEAYRVASLKKLYYELNRQYGDLKEYLFDIKSYRKEPAFLNYFPIVLSTTHSLKYCALRGTLFDYVIIDESSQVDLASATVALGQAKNAVIVGDSKQLPHVIPERLHEPLDEIRKKYVLPPFMDYRRYSLLESLQMKYGGDIPSTLLNEHYRCDPEIIGFCNKRFYDNQLVIQTKHREGCGITIVETPSNTAIRRTNPRQAEVIATEIIPNEKDISEVGVVAPYRDQVSLIRERLGNGDVLVDTVHKFQGKERSTIVMSTTSDRVVFKEDPEHVDFLNNPNLINVAISRAKDHLFVIASRELLTQEGTLLQDLDKYVSYYSSSGDSGKVSSKVFSVFDLMFDDYAPILQNMKNRMLHISEFDSENIIATVINNLCASKKYGLLSYKFNYPFNRIINAGELSDIEDRNFVLTPGTHCDFVIFDRLNKGIRLIVEVDGKQHEDPVQKSRDERKDRILCEAGLKLIRIKTTDTNVVERIEGLL